MISHNDTSLPEFDILHEQLSTGLHVTSCSLATTTELTTSSIITLNDFFIIISLILYFKSITAAYLYYNSVCVCVCVCVCLFVCVCWGMTKLALSK